MLFITSNRFRGKKRRTRYRRQPDNTAIPFHERVQEHDQKEKERQERLNRDFWEKMRNTASWHHDYLGKKVSQINPQSDTQLCKGCGIPHYTEDLLPLGYCPKCEQSLPTCGNCQERFVGDPMDKYCPDCEADLYGFDQLNRRVRL